jgi:hypothetical protein
MVDFAKLSVSLTKHGAHKLATLLRVYDSDRILEHLEGSVPGVNIELAQAKKNLWARAKDLGEQVIDGLVLIAIISSHHTLVEALVEGQGATHATGVIRRGKTLDKKAYTNFAHILEQLGYSTEHTTEAVRYDFTRLFTVPALNALAVELLDLKLRSIGWKGTAKDLPDQLIAYRLHEAFAVSEEFFRDWLAQGAAAGLAIPPLIEDTEFFSEDQDDAPVSPFNFAPGHNPKKTGVVFPKSKSKVTKMTLLHNKMQTELYGELVAKHGQACVGTEVPSGVGKTKIDLVVRIPTRCEFYEIKTSRSVKACIREAIPQLLEYALWNGKKSNCDRMIIVGPKALTPQADAYLKGLRTLFGLELHYHHHAV